MLAIIQFQNCSASHSLSKTMKNGTQENIISPAVLNGCETWSLASKEEHLDTLPNKVLRKTIRAKTVKEGEKFRITMHLGILYNTPTSFRTVE
jgi:hypothetical protein